MARSGARRKLDRCIYEDASGRAVIVQVNGATRELRFSPDIDLEQLRTERDQLRADLRDEYPALARGTLAADAVRYLKLVGGRPGFKADRSHLRAWLDRLGPRPRARITRTDVLAAMAAWRTKGVYVGGRGVRKRKAIAGAASEKTIKERWRVLMHLYHTLDGPKAKTPCDDVTCPTPAASTPVGVNVTIVQKVADAFAKRAAGTKIQSAERRDYARYLMVTTTAQRPAQLRRAILEDFHVAEQFWIVRGAKGGPTHAIHLNKEMRAAVRRFLSSGALGAYDTTRLLALARSFGWPKRVPLYNARHSVAIDAIEAGADLGDVQALLGHASIDTTRRFYAGILRLRQRNVGKRLEGRLRV